MQHLALNRNFAITTSKNSVFHNMNTIPVLYSPAPCRKRATALYHDYKYAIPGFADMDNTFMPSEDIRGYRIQNVKWRGPRFEFRLYSCGSNLIGRSRCRPSPGPFLLLIDRLYICQSTGKNLYFPMVPLFF